MENSTPTGLAKSTERGTPHSLHLQHALHSTATEQTNVQGQAMSIQCLLSALSLPFPMQGPHCPVLGIMVLLQAMVAGLEPLAFQHRQRGTLTPLPRLEVLCKFKQSAFSEF